MKKCSEGCIPCCDFCIHVIHDKWQSKDGKPCTGDPESCGLHNDIEHNKIAVNCGYCDDYHCFRYKEGESRG